MKLLSFIFVFLFLTGIAYTQQLDFTWGVKQSGTAWDGAGKVYLDTTAATSTDFYVDLSKYYPGFDLKPIYVDSVTNLGDSDRQLIGTLYGYFDCQGTGSPTTDSVKYLIKVYPGVYATASRSIASAKFGTAITLETVLQAGDYLSIKGVYILDAVKLLPPELIKVTVGPAATKVPAIDDSVAFYWRLVYPEVHNQEAIQIDKVD